MATIVQAPLSKSKTKLHHVKVDMTPMVDLGFLLITFFIFTTSMMEPTSMKLMMPKDDPTTIQHVYEKGLITLLVDKDKVFVYNGAFQKAFDANKITQTNFHLQTGVGHFIREKQKLLDVSNEKDDLFVAIKPLATASYQDVMNALDEMLINGVKRYGIMNLSDEEKQLTALKAGGHTP